MVIFPTQFDATCGTDHAASCLLFSGRKRPVTGVIIRRSNQPKRRLIPARIRRYFDFIAARRGNSLAQLNRRDFEFVYRSRRKSAVWPLLGGGTAIIFSHPGGECFKS